MRDAIEVVESRQGLVRTAIANRLRFNCRKYHSSMSRRAIVLRMLSAKIAPNRLGLKKIAIYSRGYGFPGETVIRSYGDVNPNLEPRFGSSVPATLEL